MHDSHFRAERDSAHAVAKQRRPAWIPTLAALVAVVVFVSAGDWQHRRLRESEALRDRIAAADRAEMVELPRNVADWAAWRFRQVRVTGTFDAARQILVDNVIHDGRAGFDVVTPLGLDDGRSVLVDRGWFPLGESREHLPMPPPPSGRVTILGRIDIPTTYYVELGGRKPPAGALWENLDPQRYAAVTGIAVLPIVIDAQDDLAGEGLVRAWSPPDFGITTHQGYMLQWYTFAAMAAGLWAWFTLRPWWRARRMAGADAHGEERSR
ncbi:MAG TPA: SURF1 family protein [Acidimicrobiia bacterium]|nr:SURF1 family protein [Acidimicrobiia bacterium]